MVPGKPMDLDEALRDLGQFGKFQVYYFTLLLFPVLLSGFRVTEYVFTTMNIPHRCRVPECEAGTSQFSPPWLSSAVPEGADHSPLPCQRYRALNTTLFNSSCPTDLFTNLTEACGDWVFADPLVTIAKDFDILCPGDYWKLTFLSSVSVFTGFLGEPLSGILSDRIGRKSVLVYGSVFICVVGLLRSASVSYLMLVVLEGVDGLVCGALFSPAFLLGLETLSPQKRLLGSMLINVYWHVGEVAFGHTTWAVQDWTLLQSLETLSPQKRLLGSMLINMYWPVGEVALGLTTWAVQDWRLMQRVFYAPMLVISILLYWLLPESVRWLHTRGRHEQVRQLFVKIAQLNRTEAFLPRIFESLDNSLDSSLSKKQDEGVVKTVRLRAVLKSPVILWRTGVCALCWIANMFSYYGISQSAVYNGSNQYLTFILVSVVEVPGYVASLWVPDWRWLGRRGAMVVSFLLTGITSLALILITPGPDDKTLKFLLFMASKFCSTFAFTVLCLYTAELFPTELRHSLLAFCSMSGRFGAIAAQQTPLLKTLVSPMLLVGLVSLVGGALALSCPETLGTRLPDTLEEAEDIGRANRRPRPSPSPDS